MRTVIFTLAIFALSQSFGNELLPGYENNPGVILFNSAKYNEAMKYFQVHLKEGDELNQLSTLYLAKFSVLNNEGKSAIKYIEKALELPPNKIEELLLAAEAYCTTAMQASIFKALKMGKKCGQYYTQAAKTQPLNIKALRTAIFFHLSAPSMAGGSKDLAEGFLIQLEQLSEEAARLPNLLMIESKKGKKEALQLADDYSARTFKQSEHLYDLANFYRDRDYIQKSENLFQQLLNFKSSTPEDWFIRDAQFQLGESYIKRGELKEGIALIEQYIKSSHDIYDPHYFWSRWRLAKAYRDNGDTVGYEALVSAIKSKSYKHNKAFAKQFEAEIN